MAIVNRDQMTASVPARAAAAKKAKTTRRLSAAAMKGAQAGERAAGKEKGPRIVTHSKTRSGERSLVGSDRLYTRKQSRTVHQSERRAVVHAIAKGAKKPLSKKTIQGRATKFMRSRQGDVG